MHQNYQMDIKRYREIDVFRGIAIFSVLLFHYTTRYNQLYGYDRMPFSFPYGHLGVQFFYIISGYVIYMSVININTWTDFIIKRFSRLYPAYWASIGLTFVMVYLFTLPGRQTSFHDALINFTMLQDWIDGVESVDGAYWTLSRFVSFYFIIFLIHLMKLKQRIVEVCLFWLLLVFISKFAELKGINLSGKISLLLLLKEGGFFIIGIMFYMIKKYGNNHSFCLVVAICLLSIFMVNGKILFISAMLFTLIFILFVRGSLEFINNRILIWLGGVSYSLYLVHQNIGYIVINILKPMNLNFFLLILVPTIISLSIATIVTYYIERPALSFIRNHIVAKNLFQRSAKRRAR